MTNWECQKSAFLILQAAQLGMQIDDAYIDVNPNSGHTYLWSENYGFTLYMEINCDLVIDDIYVLWSNPEDGEEIESRLTNFNNLNDIYRWLQELENEYNDQP